MGTKATVITADNFQEEVLNAGKPVILDFWATWCPHCKRIAPSYDKVAAEYEGKLVVGKVDADEEPAIAQKFEVEYLPTFILLDAEGNVLDKVVSPANKAAIDEFIAKNVAL
ncbi:MAG: thioredoxin [Clostridia bacterium]|nr:thioredoxin [Clostridia bacterium]MBO7689971.1 thioredoxin [Clostridia bacterium]MBP5271495.1 thioredoxin [Clostridia bacterium]MBP5460216.1 thioredoxin [Clostridia bacterium]